MEQPGFDRILKLTFTRGGGRNVLVHEMMGRHSNLLLLDGAEQILAVGRPISKADGAARDLIPHAKYQLPPHQRPDPRGLSTRECTTSTTPSLPRAWGVALRKPPEKHPALQPTTAGQDTG